MQLHDVSEGINAVVLRLQRHKACMAAIAHVNGGDGGGARSNMLPDTDPRQMLAGALSQRDSAGIKTRMCLLFRSGGFDKMHRQRAVRQARDSQRKRSAGHPAANDNYAHECFAAAISASISSAFFTTLAVRFSLPFSVIRMSSSIRIPMPRYWGGTSASGAI